MKPLVWIDHSTSHTKYPMLRPGQARRNTSLNKNAHLPWKGRRNTESPTTSRMSYGLFLVLRLFLLQTLDEGDDLLLVRERLILALIPGGQVGFGFP